MHQPDDAIELHDDYASAHFNKGIAHDNLGETLQAIDSFTRSLDLNPSNERVRQLLGGVLLSQAKHLLNNVDTAEAEVYLLRAMSHVDDSIENIDASDPRALHLRCEIGNALEYDAEVNLRYCNAALKANRKEIQNRRIVEDVTYNLLGIISKQLGKYDDAVHFLSQGLGVNAESYDILINLATIHADINNYELATTYFEQAETLDITDPFIKSFLFANKGWLMEKQGLRLSAQKHYTEAIDLSQPNPHPQIVTNLYNIERYCESNHCE